MANLTQMETLITLASGKQFWMPSKYTLHAGYKFAAQKGEELKALRFFRANGSCAGSINA